MRKGVGAGSAHLCRAGRAGRLTRAVAGGALPLPCRLSSAAFERQQASATPLLPPASHLQVLEARLRLTVKLLRVGVDLSHTLVGVHNLWRRVGRWARLEILVSDGSAVGEDPSPGKALASPHDVLHSHSHEPPHAQQPPTQPTAWMSWFTAAVMARHMRERRIVSSSLGVARTGGCVASAACRWRRQVVGTAGCYRLACRPGLGLGRWQSGWPANVHSMKCPLPTSAPAGSQPPRHSARCRWSPCRCRWPPCQGWEARRRQRCSREVQRGQQAISG